MYCSSCGSSVNEGQSFCPNCGAPVAQPAPQPAVQVQQPQPVAQPVAQPVPQPVAKPVYTQPVAASPAPAKKSRGFAIAGFILGLYTLPMSWVIFLNIISVFTGLAGIILAIIWFAKKKRRLKPMVIIGIIASLVGMIYSILMWASFWSDAVYNFMEPLVKILY